VNFTEEEFQRRRGSLFTFRLRALTRGFRRRPAFSEFSNSVQATLLEVSGPAENLRARTTVQGIELEWNPPSKDANGRVSLPATAWRVYQDEKGERESLRLLGETSAPNYLVRDIVYGRTYTFRVRAVFRQGHWEAESEDSAEVQVTPRDAFPPEAPSGLTAVYAAGAVELIWTANTEPDLGGYNIYRQEASGPWQRVNPEIQRTPLWRDATINPGREYSYRVTALDLAGNESPPSGETTVETM
jgi:predicted phage tail protein